ncbi:hypothetical protein BDY19DRAFT_235439 [Irpex rosettiformis]|uniref:Uncharacterized protein n=1 Tax=Irpex rosettiformis TaxID=378272 RepID=A0ACB8U008_9APHY|nr:hypothetical protein BDY19DRAFT_235439 [Irpex rosettiformis]
MMQSVVYDQLSKNGHFTGSRRPHVLRVCLWRSRRILRRPLGGSRIRAADLAPLSVQANEAAVSECALVRQISGLLRLVQIVLLPGVQNYTGVPQSFGDVYYEALQWNKATNVHGNRPPSGHIPSQAVQRQRHMSRPCCRLLYQNSQQRSSLTLAANLAVHSDSRWDWICQLYLLFILGWS